MASTKETKQERAEAAAKLAAKDLEDVNRAKEVEQRSSNIKLDRHEYGQEEQRPGVIGSVLRAVQGTYENAKEAIVGKSHDATETAREGETGGAYDSATGKAKEYKDYAAEKAKETKDSAMEKAGEYKDYTWEKAKETKDSAMGKAGEYKAYTAEKAEETKDSAMGKAGEYKDYTAEKAREMRGYAADKAEQGKERLGEYKDYAAQKAKDAKDAAVGKAGEYKDYGAEKAGQGKDATVEKAREGKDAAVSKLGELKDSARRAVEYLTGKKDEAGQKAAETGEAAKEKMSEAARQKMEEMKTRGEGNKEEEYFLKAQQSHGGTGTGTGGGRVEINAEETPLGYVAATLKDADQMTGQTFNDVGRIHDEGTIKLDRDDRHGKM